MEEKKTKEKNKKNAQKGGNSNFKANKLSKKEKKELAAFYDQMSTDPFPFGGELND